MMTHSNIKFSIYRADGSKPPSLRKSFIIKERISCLDLVTGSLRLRDGSDWLLEVEPEALAQITRDNDAYCILSLQVHTDEDTGDTGNYAVVRLFKGKTNG